MVNKSQLVSTGGLVSVIIPCFNHGQYVVDAISSVLNQSYHNFEVIVVDDGSTDNTREIVATIGGQVLYIWQQNQGLSAARNSGIKAAKGSYIGLLDADDMYEPDFLYTLVSILEGDPLADAAYCGYQFVDQQNNPLPQCESRVVSAEDLYQALVDGNFLVPESILVHRHCYKNVGLFDERLRACEDMDMWLRISSQHHVIGTNKVLIRHRILQNSMSTDPARQYQNRMAVIRKHFGDEPTNTNGWENTPRRAYGQAYLHSAIEYLQNHDEDHARELISAMAQVYPELLLQLNTFYELGCGGQPKGFRGDFKSLNIEQNASFLENTLEELFDMPDPNSNYVRFRGVAFGNAYFTLGLLSYGARKFGHARRFFVKSVSSNLKMSLNRKLVSTFVKSLLGSRVIDALKREN